MSITKKFTLSALAISAALGLAAATPQSHQGVNASRRRYSRVYRAHRGRRHIRRTRRFRRRRSRVYYAANPARRRRARRYYLRFHGKIVGWAFSYRTYRKDQAYINTLGALRRKRRAHRAVRRTPRRRSVRRHRTRYYHIYADGYDDGWTNSYQVYKQRLGQLKQTIAASQAQSQEAQATSATGSSQNQPDSDDQAHGTESQEQDAVTNPDEPSTDNQQAANNQSTEDTSQSQQSNDVNMNLAEMKAQTIADINQDRENNGLAPYTENQQLDNIAEMRAEQCQTNFSHVNPNTDNYYTSEDAYRLGYVTDPTKNYYGENITAANTGRTSDANGVPVYNQNGQDMANTDNNGFMNEDTGSNYGHRDNILNSNLKQVGVGASYSNNSRDPFPYKLVEDFSY